MAELTVQEFVTELVMDLEKRLEGSFLPIEERALETVLRQAIRRLEAEDA